MCDLSSTSGRYDREKGVKRTAKKLAISYILYTTKCYKSSVLIKSKKNKEQHGITAEQSD